MDNPQRLERDLMLMSLFNDIISVRWHGHVERREDGRGLRRAFNFEIKGHRKGD